MKRITLFSIVFVALFFIQNLFANNLESVTPENAYQMQTEGKAIIVDVREASEVKEGKVKDAIFLPMSLMTSDVTAFEKTISGFDKNKTIIVYCHSGRRAGIVGAELEKKQFKVLNMGGFDTWKSKKLPTE